VSRVIFTGRFGSGKTEVAVNFALHLVQRARDARASSPHTTLIDLDIVTPYFRSREVAEMLQAKGVHVATPAAVSRHLDVPGITPQILGLLQSDASTVILDVGGDEQGARALGQYSSLLRQRGYAMYFVVNPYRPFTGDTEGIRNAIADIERSSRLLVTGLVSNPHIMADTTPDDLVSGQRIVERASRQLSLPIIFTAIERGLAPAVESLWPAEMPVLPIERFFEQPWMA